MRTVPLSQGYEARVDSIDYEWAMQWKWSAFIRPHGVYAVRQRRRDEEPGPPTIYMHREILARKLGQYDFPCVDHEDGDGLNNSRQNLRAATSTQNRGNCRKRKGASRFKGVSWHRATGKWRAQLGKVHLGIFTSEVEAACAYDEAARRQFGDFAHVNFHDEDRSPS
jgi:hypothetical protein